MLKNTAGSRGFPTPERKENENRRGGEKEEKKKTKEELVKLAVMVEGFSRHARNFVACARYLARYRSRKYQRIFRSLNIYKSIKDINIFFIMFIKSIKNINLYARNVHNMQVIKNVSSVTFSIAFRRRILFFELYSLHKYSQIT